MLQDAGFHLKQRGICRTEARADDGRDIRPDRMEVAQVKTPGYTDHSMRHQVAGHGFIDTETQQPAMNQSIIAATTITKGADRFKPTVRYDGKLEPENIRSTRETLRMVHPTQVLQQLQRWMGNKTHALEGSGRMITGPDDDSSP